MNRFSVYLPFTEKQIDDFVEFNKTLKESEILYLYNALPLNNVDNTGYEQNRGYYSEINTLDDFLYYVDYASKKGFEVIYLLNSARGLQLDNPLWFNKSLQKLDKLMNGLYNAGCRRIKIGNTQLLEYITKEYPKMTPMLSTVLGYKEISQYKNIKEQYPNIDTAVLVYDSNKNIPLIENIQKLGIKVKLMVNEGCMSGCPYRHSHDVFPIQDTSNIGLIDEHWTFLQKETFTNKCVAASKKNLWEYVFKSNIIYPHQIKQYNKYGVYDFKIAGRGEKQIKSGFQDEFIKNYIRWIENTEGYDDTQVLYFNRALYHYGSEYYKKEGPTMKQVKKYLPDLRYFAKHRGKCSTDCGFNCNYCKNQAEKFERTL